MITINKELSEIEHRENRNKLIKKIFNNVTEPNEHIRGSIITRTKDGNDETRIIKRVSFKNKKDYGSKIEKIKTICDLNNARFYINPTVKSYESIAYDLLIKTTELIANKNYEATKNIYDSVADKNKGVKDKRIWIIDIDDIKLYTEYQRLKNEIIDEEYIIHENKTKGGMHILIKPHHFKVDISKFKYNIELKKNAMTLVYWPNNESRKKKVLLG